MSYADDVFVKNCKDILSKGVWDTDREVRPRWEDGSPAHTIKLFGVVDRYDLRKEFPILTMTPRESPLRKGWDESGVEIDCKFENVLSVILDKLP